MDGNDAFEIIPSGARARPIATHLLDNLRLIDLSLTRILGSELFRLSGDHRVLSLAEKPLLLKPVVLALLFNIAQPLVLKFLESALPRFLRLTLTTRLVFRLFPIGLFAIVFNLSQALCLAIGVLAPLFFLCSKACFLVRIALVGVTSSP